MSATYLETTRNVYKGTAENPQKGLCCTTTPVWQLPGLEMPKKNARNELWVWKYGKPAGPGKQPENFIGGCRGRNGVIAFRLFQPAKRRCNWN